MWSLQLVLRSAWGFVNELVVVEWSCQTKWTFFSGLTHPTSCTVFPSRRFALTFSSGQTRGEHIYRTISFQPFGLRWNAPCQSTFGSSVRSAWVYSTLSPSAGLCRGLVHGHHHPRFRVSGSRGRTFSPTLNVEAQLLFRRSEEWEITLVPQFITGAQNVIADSVVNTEWMLAQNVVNSLQTQWPDTVDLFATSLTYHLLVYFSL